MKKGFTLIELLAVIVILAIIALVAVPIVINIIDDAERNAAVRSAEGYVRAVNYKIAQEILNNREVSEEEEYIIGENELALTGNNLDGITGSYILSNSRVLWAGLCVNNYSIEHNSETGSTFISTTNNYCTGDVLPEFVEPVGEYMSAACTDSTLYTNTTNFKIKTVEDLACLSNLVNGGSNFQNKTIYLVSDIDFNDTSSYSNSNTTAYGDINGDSTTSGLKEELTTGKGFRPIGNSATNFKGTFEGYAFTISNLMINRPTESYVGLFGINMGSINGLKLRGINVTGGSMTGGLVGYNPRAVTNIDIKGSVSSSLNMVGGVVGKTEYQTGNPSKNDELLFSGTVTGSDSVGGLVGWSSAATLNGVVYDSTITATAPTANVTYIGKILGNRSNYSNGSYKVSNVSLVYDGSKAQSTAARDGSNYSKLRLHNIDDAVDTYIGGDSNGDYYYIDYDNEYKLTLYSTVRNPIQLSKLKGEGTEASPYLIKNIKDWKMATATLSSTAKYYTITNNLDFNNEYYYALGTFTTKFNGVLDGGMKTISNISMENDAYTGIFGYNSGTIKNLVFDNTTIVGKNNTGLVVGHNQGTINGIIGRSISVTGEENTGGVAGYNPRVITNADIRGTIIGTINVGGIAGKSEYQTGNPSKNDDIVFSGIVTATDRVGGLIGWSSAASLNGAIYDSTITATAPTANVTYIGKIIGYRSNHSNGSYKTSNVSLVYDGSVPQATLARDGTNYTTLRLHNVDDAVDTYIGGVEGSDNYYFDYGENGKIILYNSTVTPITNTLSGAGTSEDPYVIASLNDWKMATATLSSTAKYYTITSDLDFNNDYMYALGTETHKFNGNINGNMHTLSNISMANLSNTGIFGYNKGTISAIKINTASITGANNTGLIVGTNEGTINGIVARNITVTGAENVGGVIGYNPRALTNADIQGTITSSGNNVGGISGKSQYITGNASKDENVVFKGTVTGPNNVGGIVGWSESASVIGVVYSSTLTGTTGTAVGNIIGYKNRFSSGNKKASNVTLSFTGTQSTAAVNGTAFTDITLANVSDTLDTTDSTNSDGYYFTLVNGEYTLATTN